MSQQPPKAHIREASTCHSTDPSNPDSLPRIFVDCPRLVRPRQHSVSVQMAQQWPTRSSTVTLGRRNLKCPYLSLSLSAGSSCSAAVLQRHPHGGSHRSGIGSPSHQINLVVVSVNREAPMLVEPSRLRRMFHRCVSKVRMF